jgi:hypothetical protein
VNEPVNNTRIVDLLERTTRPVRPQLKAEVWAAMDAALSPMTPAAVRSKVGRRRVKGWWPVVGAAAVVAMLTASWAIRRGVRTEPTDSTTATTPVAPTSIARTSAPITTTSTSSPSTTTAPTVTATTVVPTSVTIPAADAIAIDYLNPPPLYEPQVFAELDGVTGRPALGDGFVVARLPLTVADRSDVKLVVLDLGSGDTNTLGIDESMRGLLAGPGPVVYGEVLRSGPDIAGVEQRFVAIALTGERAGQTILDIESPGHAMDPLSEWFFGHSADGVIDVWNNDTVLTPFLGADGSPIASPITDWPQVRYNGDGTVRQLGGPTWQLAFERHPDAPNAKPNFAGAGPGDTAVFATWIGPRIGDDVDYGEPTGPVIASLTPDGQGTWFTLPEGWWVGDSNVWGTLLVSRTDTTTRLAWFEPAAD